MFRRLRRVTMTIRGQITIIILVALVTIISMGDAVERWAREDLAAPDLENIAEKLNAIAELLGPPLLKTDRSSSPTHVAPAGTSNSRRRRPRAGLRSLRATRAFWTSSLPGCFRQTTNRQSAAGRPFSTTGA